MASQSPSSSTSLKASRASLTTSRTNLPQSGSNSNSDPEINIPIDTLVNHLLASKRSLSSINHVLTANELATSARALHEDVSLLYANATFLRASVIDEAAILVRLRRSLQASYDWGKKEFKRLVRRMDEADGELGGTMGMLRGTVVGREIWSHGGDDEEEIEQEEERNLLDFVDEAAVEGMREAMKKSIEQLQTYQQSFDGDLLRFDNDIRALKKAIVDSPPLDDPSDDQSLIQEADHLLDTITEESSHMAVLLTSLTKHFDMCVTAIRTTEGAAALAKRRVKEVKEKEGLGDGVEGGEGVSISGVIAEQERLGEEGDDLAPDSQEDRKEMMRVVLQDAEEVPDVVAEITDRLVVIQDSHSQLQNLLSQTQHSHNALLIAYTHLLTTSLPHLPDYLASESYFLTSYSHESSLIDSQLQEMSSMREFYEGYASSFAALLLERERRYKAEERVKGIWKKARREVEKVIEEDEGLRGGFREEAGGWLPGDLWRGLGEGARRWEVVEVDGEGKMGRVLER